MNIDRATASRINALISPVNATDTLSGMSALIQNLGYFIAISSATNEDSEVYFAK